ncbi:MAG TPA: copper chaperone PCu(A)C [Phenylobacterium sp.]|nr:copper chaperone PCu(A)C [Phenylobacterium sp.]
MRFLPRLLRLTVLAALLLPASAAQARVYRAGPLQAADPWSRPAVAGLNGVGYLRLANRGPGPETLVKVESPLARRVEMHRSSLSGAVMSMAPVARIETPAGGAVVFAPGGYHLMFLDLKRTLRPGDQLPATLIFADGRKLRLAFAVGSGEAPVGHSDAAGGRVAERSQSVTKK